MMPEKSLVANEICFGACMSACEKGRQWVAALALLQQMQQAGLEASEQVLNSVFTACEACGRLDLAPSRGSLWALARLEPPPETIRAAVKATEATTAEEVSKIWWRLEGRA